MTSREPSGMNGCVESALEMCAISFADSSGGGSKCSGFAYTKGNTLLPFLFWIASVLLLVHTILSLHHLWELIKIEHALSFNKKMCKDVNGISSETVPLWFSSIRWTLRACCMQLCSEKGNLFRFCIENKETSVHENCGLHVPLKSSGAF